MIDISACVVELVNRRQALGQDFAVRAMRAVDVVVGVEQIGLADGRPLPGRSTGGPGPRWLYAMSLKCPCFLTESSISSNARMIIMSRWMRTRSALRDGAGRQFVGHAAVVLIERNRLEFDEPLATHLAGSIITPWACSELLALCSGRTCSTANSTSDNTSCVRHSLRRRSLGTNRRRCLSRGRIAATVRSGSCRSRPLLICDHSTI